MFGQGPGAGGGGVGDEWVGAHGEAAYGFGVGDVVADEVVVGAEGKPVDRTSTLQRIVRSHKPGETLSFEVMRFGAKKSFRVKLVEAPTQVDYDLDHVALFTEDPSETADAYTELGFESTMPSDDGHPRVEVGGAYIEFHPGDPGSPEKPLLNHLAVLVDSADEHTREAEAMGIVDNVVDAANTRAVFVWGPDRVRIEYVEHKPEFSLR